MCLNNGSGDSNADNHPTKSTRKSSSTVKSTNKRNQQTNKHIFLARYIFFILSNYYDYINWGIITTHRVFHTLVVECGLHVSTYKVGEFNKCVPQRELRI